MYFKRIKILPYLNFQSIEIGQELFKTLLIWTEYSTLIYKVYVRVCLAFWVKLCKKVLHLTLLSAGTKKSVCVGKRRSSALQITVLRFVWLVWPLVRMRLHANSQLSGSTQKKNSQQKLNELAARLLFDGDLWTNWSV